MECPGLFCLTGRRPEGHSEKGWIPIFWRISQQQTFFIFHDGELDDPFHALIADDERHAEGAAYPVEFPLQRKPSRHQRIISHHGLKKRDLRAGRSGDGFRAA